MDGIAFDWCASLVYRVAHGWVRPRRLLARFDMLAAVVAIAASYLLLYLRPMELHAGRLSHIIFQSLLSAVLLVLLYRSGQYLPERRMSRLHDIATLTKSMLLAFFFVCGVWLATDGFFTGFRDESRLLVFSAVLILAGLLTLNRVVLTWYQRRLFARGEGMRNVVLIGQGRVAGELMGYLAERPRLGVRCAGSVPASSACFSVKRARQVLEANEACDLILALDPEEMTEFNRVVTALNHAGLSYSVVPSLFEASLGAARAYGFREPPVINVEADASDHVQLAVKRTMDLAVSIAALLVTAPLLLAIAILVRLDSKGPVVFRQVRLGYAGRPFEILKFRTMVPEAEAQLAKLKCKDEGDGPHFKMKQDPRITRIGAFLRRWSLDELLQFVNVLRGDMSLVGPRPPLPREVEKYEISQLIRLKGKPGITGLWQVSGRKNLTFDDMVSLDRKYLENWSLGMDIKILARTVSVVLARRGAY